MGRFIFKVVGIKKYFFKACGMDPRVKPEDDINEVPEDDINEVPEDDIKEGSENDIKEVPEDDIRKKHPRMTVITKKPLG